MPRRINNNKKFAVGGGLGRQKKTNIAVSSAQYKKAKGFLPKKRFSNNFYEIQNVGDANAIEVKVCLYLFDLLYINGKSLTAETYRVRRERMRKTFQEVPGSVTFANSLDTSEPEEIQHFMDEAIQGNCEGILI